MFVFVGLYGWGNGPAPRKRQATISNRESQFDSLNELAVVHQWQLLKLCDLVSSSQLVNVGTYMWIGIQHSGSCK